MRWLFRSNSPFGVRKQAGAAGNGEVESEAKTARSRRSRRWLFRAAGLGAVAVGEVGVLSHEGNPTAYAASNGTFSSSSSSTPAVQATGTNGAQGVRASSDTSYAVYGTSTSGAAVRGTSSSNSGVLGTSTTGYGVYGAGVNTSGVYGTSSKGTGVQGYSTAASGHNSIGIWGTGNDSGVHGNSPQGTGVSGISTLAPGAGNSIGVSGSGNDSGVYGTSSSGIGVSGSSTLAPGTTGISIGVKGSGNDIGVSGTSTVGNGIYGATSGFGSSGVYGTSSAHSSNAVMGQILTSGLADTVGVYGSNVDGYGMRGQSTNGTAIAGQSTNGYGVYGSSSSSQGVYGASSTNNGVEGHSAYASSSGVYGQNDNGGYGVTGQSASGPGVYGQSNTNVGVYALSGRSIALYATGTPAGTFAGDVNVNGNLSKSGGSFLIDHPLDPANKSLYHSFVESPDMMNIYVGMATLDAKGEAIVSLPDWFDALNGDFHYQLTCVGGHAPVYISQKIVSNRFTIAGGHAGLEVSWQVTGTRQDAWAQKHRIPVEVEKTGAQKGKYYHPELFGAAKEQGIYYHTPPAAPHVPPKQP